ncbi:hypothetical protein BKA93DRAFT_825539 [Sparassis latifolia]|uniref:C2 NT-type domain-containing protein n=1 Tax=Sparassis crispa TaxID=139825 RepID=A0A401GMC0_9APHY|nr:predicted protein [Sparassis crispa]GBE83367.1 predicted protein [Sparassis crispa]
MTKTPTARSVSSASASSTASHGASHGFRSQIGHLLLPRHAVFQVRVHIDQLSNVPLIGGQFAVRWKFKNVQSGPNLLSKMRGHKTWTAKRKGKARASDIGLEINVTPGADEGHGEEEDGDSSAQEQEQELEEEVEDEVNGEVTATYGGRLTSSPAQTAMPLPLVPGTATGTQRPALRTPNGALQTSSSTSVSATGEGCSVARGMTEWVKLQSYNAKWEHTVNVVVEMDVHRETGDLLPSEFKLVVMQRVIAGDPDAPRHPRLGKLYLNLAEYADAGSVTRRYLLRESKTNATLKLTIELEHIGGEKNYKPPPLRKSEILASVSGLLSNNELLRTSVARQLDDFTRTELPRTLSYDGPLPDGYSWVTDTGIINEERLASSYGLRSTENLIEALFNPVPTNSETPSPFTYYVPPGESDVGGSSDSSSYGGDNSISADSTSGHTGSSLTEDLSQTGLSSMLDQVVPGLSDGPRTWWRKIRSRPSTPITRQHNKQLLATPLPAVLVGVPPGNA